MSLSATAFPGSSILRSPFIANNILACGAKLIGSPYFFCPVMDIPETIDLNFPDVDMYSLSSSSPMFASFPTNSIVENLSESSLSESAVV